MQGLVKFLPQSGDEGERSAEVDNFSADPAALCETCDRLVHDCLKYGGGDVLNLCPLVYERLDIRLCEYAAAACDSIGLSRLPWFMRGWTSVFANTPQRLAIV